MSLLISEWNVAVCPYCDAEFDSFDMEDQLEEAGIPRTNKVMVYQNCQSCGERVEITITYKITAYLEAK